MKVIGFVGLPGSGKSEVLNAIKNLGVIITMGDVVRNEARERNIDPSDENLGKIAQDLREAFGPEIIAEKCEKLIRNLDANVIFIDGLRSNAEVKVFRKSWKFPVIAVVIDDKTRFERLSKRGRPDDPNTLEDLRERDLREISFGLKEVIDTANYKIDNTDPKIVVQKKIRELVLNIICNY